MDRSHDARRAALEQTRQALRDLAEADLAALHRQMQERRHELTVSLETAERDAANITRAIKRELVADAFGALTPLVKEWVQQPTRPLTETINTTLGELVARQDRECPVAGNPADAIGLHALAVLFADAVIQRTPRAVGPLSADIPHWSGAIVTRDSVAGRLEALRKVLGAPPVVFCRALEDLEAAITVVGSDPRVPVHTTDHVDRYKVVRQLDPEALLEHDRQVRERGRFAEEERDRKRMNNVRIL